MLNSKQIQNANHQNTKQTLLEQVSSD